MGVQVLKWHVDCLDTADSAIQPPELGLCCEVSKARWLFWPSVQCGPACLVVLQRPKVPWIPCGHPYGPIQSCPPIAQRFSSFCMMKCHTCTCVVSLPIQPSQSLSQMVVTNFWMSVLVSHGSVIGVPVLTSFTGDKFQRQMSTKHLCRQSEEGPCVVAPPSWT